MRVFEQNPHNQSVFLLKKLPFAMIFHQGIPGTALFGDDEGYHLGCLGCINPRCLYFDEDEVTCGVIDGFPNDKFIGTCPVGAISWDDDRNTPRINSDQCCSCGICVSRCPTGALFFMENGELNVNSNVSEFFERKCVDEETKREHTCQINQLLTVPREGVFLNATDRIFESIYNKLFRIKSQYHNIVGRNLLIALGCKCAMRRTGDVYTRMDAVYFSANCSIGAVEIEFGRDSLDAARGILDDIAVLNTRYGICKQDNIPLVICMQLPNIRQGYWQVLKDINLVEDIKIETITVGALMMLLWYGFTFEPEDARYYLDYDNMDLRQILCVQMDCDNLPISNKKLGVLEPIK